MAKSRAVEGRSPDILLEVRPVSASGDLAPRARGPEDFRSRAGEIADSIAEIAEHFRSRLEQILDKSDDSAWRAGSIEVTFDIAAQAEGGVVIAKTTPGATFSVRVVLQAPQERQR
jgi:hypothetical protein